MRKTLVILVLASLTLCAGCSAPHTDLKSPCVGAAGSPCDRRPVNQDTVSPQQS